MSWRSELSCERRHCCSNRVRYCSLGEFAQDFRILIRWRYWRRHILYCAICCRSRCVFQAQTRFNLDFLNICRSTLRIRGFDPVWFLFLCSFLHQFPTVLGGLRRFFRSRHHLLWSSSFLHWLCRHVGGMEYQNIRIVLVGENID